MHCSLSPSSSISSTSVSAVPVPSTSSAAVTFLPSTAKVRPTNANEMASNDFPSSSLKHQQGLHQQPQQRFRHFEDGKRIRTDDAQLGHGNFIAIPPAPNGPREQQQKQPQWRQSTDKNGGEGVAMAIQQKLFENYHLVAYSLVIVTYLLAFCEYLYLRLLSLVFPEPVVYRRNCDKHHFEIILRNEVHFASGCAVFLLMSVYQLVYFFLLTVSSRFMEIKRTYSHVISIEQRLRQELILAVQRTMFATLYPTFAIYMMCSAVILCSIFYMVGLRDQIVHVGSLVIIYVFDLFVLLYFLAFPVLCVLFHPDIDCRGRFARIFCWPKRSISTKGTSAATEPPVIVGRRAVTEQSTAEQIGADGNAGGDDGTDSHRLGNSIEHTQNAAATYKAQRKRIPAGRFSSDGAVYSVPASLDSMARIGKDGQGSFCFVPTLQQPMAQLGSATNYGSLERRPRGAIMAENLDTESTLPTGTSVCIKAIRQRRRGDRYRRLRGGSDESAECRQGTTDDAKTTKEAAGTAKTDGPQASGERWHAQNDAGGAEPWEDAGTVSC